MIKIPAFTVLATITALLTLPVYQSARADALWSGFITAGETTDLTYSGTLPAEAVAFLSAAGGGGAIIPCDDSGCLTSPDWEWSASVSITNGQGPEPFFPTVLRASSCDDPDSCLGVEGLEVEDTSPRIGTLNDSTIVISDFTSSGGCQVIEGSGCDGFSPPTGMDISIDIVGDGELQVTATPLLPALPLFATGLGTFGLLGWRRKRKASAALA